MSTFTSLKSKLLVCPSSIKTFYGWNVISSKPGWPTKKSIIFFQGTSYAETMGFA
jgi:hypothetical protein